jgi:hypothetical protein
LNPKNAAKRKRGAQGVSARRKGDRASSIRRLTAREVAVLEPKGGIVDESVPPSAVATLRRFGIERAAAELGRCLGRYRERAAERNFPIDAELRITEETIDVIEELRLRLDRIPQTVDAYANAAVWKRCGESFHAHVRSIDRDLGAIRQALWSGIEQTEKLKGRSGGKPYWARDTLVREVLNFVSSLTGGTKKKAQEITHEVLQTCGIPLPQDFADFQKLTRKTGKDQPGMA